jgi:predicted dehydrogenase
MKIAREKGVTLAVFQQTFFAPFYRFVYDTIKSGKLGDVKQISVRYNGFARRWDWQTLQRKCAGSTYNTGPHPIGMGLGLIDFDSEARVVFSRLDTALTSGDADDYAKIIIAAPGKPVVDIEISSIDAYSSYTLKIQGSKGTLKATPKQYEITYIADGENPPKPIIEESLRDANGNPIYCSEKLVTHEEEGSFKGSAFDSAVKAYYDTIYDTLVNGAPLVIKTENIAKLISELETVVGIRVLPYHNYAGSKYAALGMENTLPENTPTKESLDGAKNIFRSYGIKVID